MARFFEDTNAGGLTRRSFLVGLGAVALAGASAAFLSACGVSPSASSSTGSAAGSVSDSGSTSASTGAGSSSSASAAAAASSSMSSKGGAKVGDKVLVAYFSAQGHTEKVAKELVRDLGADIFVITPADKYTTKDLDYNSEKSRVVQEYENKDKRDTKLAQTTPDNWGDYDTVLLGYPIWWSDSAWAMWRFASDNDFSGKTVIPFCTSYSSDLGDSGDKLAKRAGTGKWVEGRRFDQDVDTDEVRQWADSLKG